MSPLLKQKRVWIPAACVLLLIVYALVGFLWAPKLLRNALLGGIHDNLGLEARVGEIHINPFLLQLEVKDFALPDREGRPLLGFQRLFVDFETSSLWRRAYVFKDIDIAAPYANAYVAQNGALNVDALKLKPKPDAPPPPPPEAKGALPRIEIASFRLAKGAAGYEDHSRIDPIVLHVDPISFELTDFTTGAEGGKFSFAGVSKRGGRLGWSGHFSLQPLASDGQFKIEELRAQTLWEYVEHQVAFVVPSGLVGLSGRYEFRMLQKPDIKVHLDGLAVKDLALGPADNEADWVRLASLDVGPSDLDLNRHSVMVEGISLDGLKVKAWREKDGSINLQRLAGKKASVATEPTAAAATSEAAAPAGAAPADSGAAMTPTATPPATSPVPGTSPPATSPAWSFQLKQFALKDADVNVQDRSVSPAVTFALAPLNLTVANISQDLSKPLQVDADVGINEAGKFSAGGMVVPAPLNADLKLQLSAFALNVLQPYLAQKTALSLREGSLNLEGGIKAQKAAASKGTAPLSLKFAGDASIDGLHTQDNQQQDLLNWNRLQVRGIDFSLGPDRLDIAQVIANKLFARVVVAPDRTLNVSRVLAGPNAAATEPSAATAAAKPVKVAAKAAGGSKQRKTSKAELAAAKSEGAGKPAAPGFPVNIRKVLVQGSTLSFTDLSLKPNFSAGINELGGSIVGLSSKPGTRAKIDLKGQVDKFSPVSIQGEANVLGPLYTDIAMSFRNMELTTFNPYSGKFAGYNISKGKLTTELSYKIDGRKLNAGHHIIIDQLEFGEKTASKDAVSLPVKLAVALLKDRNGVIDLDVPVTGSLDDPHFRLGPIIWKVVMNLLVKIVTSPFALLGSMFGGGPDLQFVDFPAGVATLDEAAQGRVKSIAKALAERPQLKIAVPLAGAADLDRPALVQAKLDALLREQEAGKSARKNADAAPPPAFDTLPPKRQLELLTAVYKKQTGNSPEFPKVDEADKGAASKAEAKEQKLESDIAFLRTQLLASIQVDDLELTELAKARAAAIQQILLTGTQIDPARVFLVANNKAKAQDRAVRLELTLE